jgi:hypothetical protein
MNTCTSGLGLRIEGWEKIRVWGLVFGLERREFKVLGLFLGFRVQDLIFMGECLGSQVEDLGFTA